MALQEKTQKFSGTSRGRVWCPGGACEVEAASPQWNNVLRPSLHFVNSGSGAGDGLVRLGCAGCGNRVGVPHLRTPCTGVLYWFLAEVQVLVSSSSLVSLLVVFLCLLLLWIGSAGQEMASGSARSTNPTANAEDVLQLTKVWCPFLELMAEVCRFDVLGCEWKSAGALVRQGRRTFALVRTGL